MLLSWFNINATDTRIVTSIKLNFVTAARTRQQFLLSFPRVFTLPKLRSITLLKQLTAHHICVVIHGTQKSHCPGKAFRLFIKIILMSQHEINILTPKEAAILELLAKGLLYKEMAAIQQVNINTIKKHCKNIYKKLQVRNRTEAAMKFNSAKAA